MQWRKTPNAQEVFHQINQNTYSHKCTFKMFKFSLPFQSTADNQDFEIYEKLSIR